MLLWTLLLAYQLIIVITRFFNDSRLFDKRGYYVSYITDDNDTTTEATTKLLLYNVRKLHDLLLLLTLDRGPQFIPGV